MPKKEPLFPHVPKSQMNKTEQEAPTARLKGIAKNYDKMENFVTWGLENTDLSSRQLEKIWEEAIKEAGLEIRGIGTSKWAANPSEMPEARLKELETEALELQRKIRAKYPETVPEPWPEELQRWQGRLWQLGYEIVREHERLKAR